MNMLQFHATALGLAAALSLCVGSQARGPEGNGQSQAQPLRAREPNATAPAGERKLSQDVILLRTGETLTGRLTEETLRLKTPYAMLELRIETLREVDFGAGVDVPTVMLARNGDRLSGKVENSMLSMVSSQAAPSSVRVETIRRVQLGSGLEEKDAEALNEPGAAATAPGPTPEGMVWIPPGSFRMGSSNEEAERGLDEGPVTEVTLSHGFWMGRCEVTQAEYQSVMGVNPSLFVGDTNRPVEKVSWQEANDYCARLTDRSRASGKLPERYSFRLPTEAEWEYACRAGTQTRFSYGDDGGYLELRSYAWFAENSNSTTHPVGTKKPNAWGLYDMHGNVWEWCQSHWVSPLPGGQVRDSLVAPAGNLRVARGGSWLYDGRFCRSANRDNYGVSNRCSDLGFRVVLAPAALGSARSSN